MENTISLELTGKEIKVCPSSPFYRVCADVIVLISRKLLQICAVRSELRHACTLKIPSSAKRFGIILRVLHPKI